MTPFSSVVPGTVSSMKPFGPLGDQPAGQCSTLRILDADVYDTLEFVAETVGGVGRGLFFAERLDGSGRFVTDDACPVCIHGCGYVAVDGASAPVNRELDRVGIGYGTNDDAVARINARLGRHRDARVPFELWRQELCVVRGPHPEPSPDASWPTQAETRRMKAVRRYREQAFERAPNKPNKRCKDGAPTSPEASI